MTTFSPEAPSSIHPPLLSALITPPSICVQLPPMLNSHQPHHNRSLSYSISILDLEEKSSVLVGGFFCCWFVFSCLHLYLHGCLVGSSSLYQFLLSLFFTPYIFTSICSSPVLPGYVFLQHATSVCHPDLCNGAAPANY